MVPSSNQEQQRDAHDDLDSKELVSQRPEVRGVPHGTGHRHEPEVEVTPWDLELVHRLPPKSDLAGVGTA